MSKKNLLIACLVIAALFVSVASAFAQVRIPDAPRAVANTLRGMNIIVGNWWMDYNPANNPPMRSGWANSDFQQRQLDYRRRLVQQYGFTMQDRNVASWNEMSQVAATSMMAGRPAASVFRLQPDWALALYRQNLLYNVASRRVIDWTATTPVEWNQVVTEAFTFNNRTFAFADGYGGSYHAACVFWNKRLFREAGLDENLPYDLQRNGQWTWDRFLEICKQLTRDRNNDGIMDTYAMPADLSTEILDALISSNGANYVSRDRNGRLSNATNTPAFIEAVQFYMRLRDEGVMKPKPEGAAWNWHIPEFQDGRVAMRIDQQYLATNDLRNMRDNWGMVLPPKGPRRPNQYTVFNDENVMVIPARGFTDAQVDAILWAVQAWVTPVDENWRLGEYPNYRDRRAVDETVAMIRNRALWQWKYHLHVPGLNRGGIAWEIWHHDGEPAQLIEAVSQNWNALIADANRR
ncbi:MAG: extracellular solute-binding protein [Treponema sp.]|nr:extracellular solute-binding protein [Treponema sp.]MCL2236876.1 extracellular solute-binding protein [Treponema sp.]